MKTPTFPTLALTVALLAATPAFSQNEAMEPGKPAPVGAPAKPAEKPKPLAATDKSFVKSSLESMYLLMSLTEKNKQDQLKVADTKTVAEKISTEFTKLWAELAPIATTNGDKLPSAVPTSDKAKIDKLGKAPGDKYDKEWIKLVGKDTKHLATAFAAAKTSQNPQIKALAATWEPTMKTINDDTDKAEKVVAKAK